MSSSSEEVPRPPEPPEIERRFRLHPSQWVGIPALMVIPILALAGVFGESRETVRTGTGEIEVEMTYPTRYRYWTLSSVDFEVTNRSGRILDTLHIDVDTTYAKHFSSVSAIPPFEHSYTIEFTGIEPGDSRRAVIEMQTKGYGRQAGEVRVTTGGMDTVRLPISSFIFP